MDNEVREVLRAIMNDMLSVVEGDEDEIIEELAARGFRIVRMTEDEKRMSG